MRAQDLIREGNVKDALKSLTESVRDDPANLDYRIFLFQLLAIDGQYERALNQLNVTGEMDAKTLMMVQTYREVLQCEVYREAVFKGEHTPLIFGDPQPWVAPMLQSLKLAAGGKHDKAQQLRDDAYDLIPAVSGSIDGEAFEWIAAADSRIGPFLEAIINGKYFWVPMSCIKAVHFHKTEDLRDLVWLPAEFTWANDGQAVGFVPVRYVNGEVEEDDIKLSRLTQWQQISENVYHGQGQRLFATDAGDYSLLDITDIQLHVQEVQAEPEEAVAAD